MRSKKGQFDQFKALAVGVLTLALVLVVTFVIIAETRDQIADIEGIDFDNTTACQTNTACNATTTLRAAAQDIPSWIPLIILAVIGGALMGLVRMFRQ